MMTNNLQEPQEEGIKIQELLKRCLRKWPWFVLSVVCCLALAIVYIKTTPPVYVRTASVLIKEEDRSSANILAEFNFLQSSTQVNNELISIQALPQIEGVVRRLNLHMDYRIEGRYHNIALYGSNLPVKATVVTPEENLYASFTLRVLEGNKVELNNFILGLPDFEEIEQPIAGSLNQKIATPVGEVTIEATPYYFGAIDDVIYISKNDVQSTTRAYASRIGAALHEKECTVIDLSFSDVSPQRAEDVLNTLIEVYNENWVNDRNIVAKATSEFITKRLTVVERELGNVESDISDFKSKTLLPDLERATDLYMSKSDKTGAELIQLYNRKSVTRYLQEYVAGELNKTQLLPANSGIESSSIEKQIGEYNEMVLNRNTLVAGSSEKNPLVKDIDIALEALHKAIIVSVNNHLISLDTQIAALEKVEAKTNSKLSKSPTQAKYLLSVERQQKVKEQLYLFLLQKREENELTQAFTSYNTRIIQPAMGSKLPAAPAKSKILMVAFILGLIIPAGVIFIHSTLDTKIHSRLDLESLSVPFLGEIPLWISPKNRKRFRFFRKKKNNDDYEIYVRDKKRNSINEAFRVLRTNIEFMIGKSEKAQIILMTSFIPNSGKTFISANLGSSLAIKGKRVLVIDGDLRKASLSKYVDSPELGISNFLTGSVDDVKKIIVPMKDIKSYDVIPVGTIPPNPSELLGSERFAELMDKLSSMYDYIFIDCPPIDIVADTQIMEQYADRTFFLVRIENLDKDFIPILENIYHQKRFKNLSVILNGTNKSQARYGYGYSYSYGSTDKH